MNGRFVAGWSWSVIVALLWCVFAGSGRGAESTFVYAVQVSAVLRSDPFGIELRWPGDPYGALSYTVYRKGKEEGFWGTPLATLPGDAPGFTDYGVTEGTGYEYQVVKEGVLGYHGYGYVYAGSKVAPTESRGTVVLVVATDSAGGLETELERLRLDLIGDGWMVRRVNVLSTETPESVRDRIKAVYLAAPDSVTTVFLFGHVPILHSGDLNYDGHAWRAMPADAYYGEMDEGWSTDPAWSPSFLPSDVELMVGRVDLADMPGLGAAVPWPSEQALLRNYLNKEHAWRHGQVQVPQRALMGNSRGDEAGLATAASGYRSFEPLVGPGNIVEANVAYSAPSNQRWIYGLGTGSYLWAYGNGAGGFNSCGSLGTRVVNGVPGNLYSVDVYAWDAKAVFVMLFGSWFGEWDHRDNLLRSFLATPGIGLASCMSGIPHWYVHHMGLGETIGYSTRLTMNNADLYRNEVNEYTRTVYIALMGDPTLRMHSVAPPGEVTASSEAGGVRLSWGAAAANVLGYHVYRASTGEGPFARLTPTPVAGTGYLDSGAAPGVSYTYMVRSLALQVTPSGSYYNLSQGKFAEGMASGPIAELPAPWSSQDIGAVGAGGYATYADGTFTIAGSGADIFGPADAFQFVSRPWNGDGEIVARITTIENTDGWAKAGAMWRESLDAGSANALVLVSYDKGAGMQWRVSSGGETVFTGGDTGARPPYWLKLAREGNSFTGYGSADGVNWSKMGSVSMGMVEAAQVGVAVTAHNDGLLNVATVDSVVVSGSPPRLQIGRSGDAVVLEVTGQPGQVYRIEGSADLIEWTPIGTVTNGGYTELMGPGNGGRFYRAAVVDF